MTLKAIGIIPGSPRAWLTGVRLPTLTAAIAPVAVGSSVAFRDGAFDPGPACAALVGAIALQIGANFANDLSDYRRGADTNARIGPPRVTQLGLLTQREVTNGMVGSFFFAMIAGLYLFFVAGWPVLVIGLASICAAITYTGGPWPFGYRGLGELFVFIFFGLVAVSATYYVQAGEVTQSVVAASVPVGLTVTAILIVNNVRDIETDREARKFTLAVYLGRRLARYQYVLFMVGAYTSTAALFIVGSFSGWTLLAWLSIPAAVSPMIAVLTRIEGPPLNNALRATARLHLIFAILLAIGLSR